MARSTVPHEPAGGRSESESARIVRACGQEASGSQSQVGLSVSFDQFAV